MARLILTERGEDVGVAGTVTVIGTTAGGEVVTIYGGNITLDPSFNRGGDTVVLGGDASGYSVRASGAIVVISDGTTIVRIPAGAGIEVRFDDMSLNLRFDTVTNSIRIGDQQVTGTAQPIAAETTDASFVSTQQTYALDDLPDDGYAHEYAVGDFNGDGLDDILLASFAYPLANVGIPITILLNQGNGTFADGTSQIFGDILPMTVHPRGIAVADFNGDGIDDIFIADHGYDAMPFPGAQNTLLLSTPTGLVDATSNLPQLIDFSHSTASGDIDGDGDIDLVVMNLYGGTPATGQATDSYILLNDRSGQFTRVNDRLPDPVAGREDRYTATLLFDADGDGDRDLFLGAFGQSENAASRILINDGSGDFSNAAEIVLPGGPFGAAHEWVMAAVAGDLDGDGNLDLVVTMNNEDRDPYIQILISDGDGGFVDQTSTRLPQDSANTETWAHSASLADFDGDGSLDLLLRNAYAAPLFLNNGSGYFEKVADTAFDYGGWGTPQHLDHIAIDVNGDGIMDVVADSQGRGFLWNFQMGDLP